METIKIADLIKALGRVGEVYRDRTGSKPADAVTKVVRRLSGAEDGMTLAEWVEANAVKARPRGKALSRRGTDEKRIEAAKAALAGAETQATLLSAIGEVQLSAGEWRALARSLTGQAGGSGKAARDIVETHFSDQLLLRDRIQSIGRQRG
jgi:hypothetical protein